MLSEKLYRFPWSRKSDRKTEEGRVYVEVDNSGTRWVRIDSHLETRKVQTLPTAYCREDELQGLIEALQKAQSELRAG